MAVSITIRDVPNETRDELAARAARSGKSLQEFLKAELIDLASKPDTELLVEHIRRRKAVTRSSLPADVIVELIAAERA